MIPAKPPLTGTESLIGLNSIAGASMLDFWRWGFSDLLCNDIRGVFGEWMVARLLGIDSPPRDSWAPCDLVTPSGMRIEVKTTAYLQVWNPQPSKTLTFSGLKGRTWTLATGYSATATFNADLYVFCLQTETDVARWNALDLAQWRFFTQTREQLESRGCRSITLSALRKITPELTAVELQREVEVWLAQRRSF